MNAKNRSTASHDAPSDESTLELMAAYRELLPFNQAIVNVLAVILNRTSRTNVILCLRKLGYRTIEKRALNVTNVDPIFDALNALGLIERIDIHVRCLPHLADAICRLLVEAGTFDEIAEAVQDAFPFETDWQGNNFPKDYYQWVREIRIGLFRGDELYLDEMFAVYPDDDCKVPHGMTPRDGRYDTKFVKIFGFKSTNFNGRLTGI